MKRILSTAQNIDCEDGYKVTDTYKLYPLQDKEPPVERNSGAPVLKSFYHIRASHNSFFHNKVHIQHKKLSTKSKPNRQKILEQPQSAQSVTSPDIQSSLIHNNLDEIYRYINMSFEENDSIFVHYNHLSSLAQVGTTCGFVALSMASQLLYPVGVRKLLNEARNLDLTLIGEMFDAYVMADFATEQLKCDASVLDDLYNQQYELLSHICDGWPVLIPYDNIEGVPGIANGELAHWAVLNGLYFKDDLNMDSSRLVTITSSKGQEVKEQLRLLFQCNKPLDPNIYVIAREGLSKQLHAWRLQNLLTSNYYLQKCSMKYGLPRDYELGNLQSKAVLLKRR